MQNGSSQKDKGSMAGAAAVGAVIGAVGAAAAIALSNKDTRTKIKRQISTAKDKVEELKIKGGKVLKEAENNTREAAKTIREELPENNPRIKTSSK